MKKLVIKDLLTLSFGFLLCLYLTKQKCVETAPVEYKVIDNTWVEHPESKVDTVYKIVDRPIPKPKIIYKTVYKDYPLLQDSFLNKDIFKRLDTTYLVSVDSNTIEINHYQDSLFTDQYELRWSAETFGYLTSMVTDVLVYKDESGDVPVEFPKEKKWAIGLGVSQRLNYKTGLFYKGWGVECEFKTKENKLDQIYFTKIISF